jgi:cytochrome oxidase assembly protein ShyY1
LGKLCERPNPIVDQIQISHQFVYNSCKKMEWRETKTTGGFLTNKPIVFTKDSK